MVQQVVPVRPSNWDGAGRGFWGWARGGGHGVGDESCRGQAVFSAPETSLGVGPSMGWCLHICPKVPEGGQGLSQECPGDTGDPTGRVMMAAPSGACSQPKMVSLSASGPFPLPFFLFYLSSSFSGSWQG